MMLCVALAPAYADVAVPRLGARVTDLTNTLTSTQRDALDRELAAFERRKGAQIAVLLVLTTAPETVEQYSIRVAENWKLGRKGIDDGALVLVAKTDRKLRIEVGYGLEGVIPDAVAKRVTDEIIIPYFRQGDFYGGIQAAVARLIRLIDGEPLPPPKARDPAWTTVMDLLPLLFIVVLVAGGILRVLLGRLLAASIAGGIVGIVAWIMVGLFIAIPVGLAGFLLVLAASTTIGRGGRGGWSSGGGWNSGGWSGGGSDGGFSGGGGGFGGGGASGSW
jgi:uncharacterized protein